VTRVPGGEHGSTVKNTFIDQIATPMLRLRNGAQRRARSVPKDMFSKKSEWESACHILGYQNCPVRNEVTRKVTLEKKGSELGLNVVFDGEALLVDDIGPGVVDSWNALYADEPISIGDRILEVNGVNGDAKQLLEQCRVSDTLILLIQPSMQATARSESNDSHTSSASLPPFSVMGAMCSMPLETPTWDSFMAGVNYSDQHGFNTGVQCFSEIEPEMSSDSKNSLLCDLSLHLGVANAADLAIVPLETPTLDRHVPAMHVSCRAAETSAFGEHSFEQPVARSWTLAPEIVAPSSVNDLCSAMAQELSMQEVNDFSFAFMAPAELSMQLPSMDDLCGVPLETPTLDRCAPTVAIRTDNDGPRHGLKLSLAHYLY